MSGRAHPRPEETGFGRENAGETPPDLRPISERARARAPSAPTGADGSPPLFDGLNPEQREAVLTTDGPLLVLAGAGTGKTRVLTTRIAHILAGRLAWPSQMLVVTFTNKAAREMRERTLALVGPDAEGLRWLGTFHSVAAQILRRHPELVGLKSGFSVLDDDDQLRLLKQILEAEGIDQKRWTPRYLLSLIDGWKNRAILPEKVPLNEAHGFADGRGGKLYRLYQERLAVLNAVDFGDLLLHNLRIFLENPDALADYHKRFRYILVDEYQDTNVAQYLWLRLLAQGSGNLCCVGDDDQSIYGWRGAEVDNILRFERDFPGAKVIRLERNYRSTGHILAAASHLITANRSRLGKTLHTEAGAGDLVKVRGVWDGESEARLISDDIDAWRSSGRRYAECAVLVRASWQMRAFEERFILAGVPYRVIGGPRFFERAEIRDALAYLRLIRSPADDLAFERVVNTPKRGVGESTVQRIHLAARGLTAPLSVAADMMLRGEEVKGPARSGLKRFLADLERWRAESQRTEHTRLMEMILEESGYTDMLQADKSPQSQSRLENLKELVRAMGAFESLQAFLEHVELVMDNAEGAGADDQVQVLTLHSAKGLEWPMVFLPGWEEEVFPSRRSLDENGHKGLEEERRLAYVGLTRARERAYISFAANRQIYGRWTAVLPSRFVDELPPAHVDAVSETGYASPAGGGAAFGGFSDFGPSRFDGFAGRSDYQSPGWKRAQARRDDRQGSGDADGPPDIDASPLFGGGDAWSGRTHEAGSEAGAAERAARTPAWAAGLPLKPASTLRPAGRAPGDAPRDLIASSDPAASSGFKRGDLVRHVKFGLGRVTAVEGAKLTIDFQGVGLKKVVETYIERA